MWDRDSHGLKPNSRAASQSVLGSTRTLTHEEDKADTASITAVFSETFGNREKMNLAKSRFQQSHPVDCKCSGYYTLAQVLSIFLKTLYCSDLSGSVKVELIYVPPLINRL